MEPLASISPALLRPFGGGDGGGVLQEGRVMAGEVLRRLDRESVLVQVAGQQVPAETPPEARVASDSGLLGAVRDLLADEEPLGRVLGDLSAALAGAGERADHGALLASVRGRQLDPEGGADALRALLTADRQAWPSALAAALGEAGVDGIEAALRRLAAHLRSVFAAQGVGLGEPGTLEHALAGALHALGLEAHPAVDLNELGQELARLLGRELDRAGAGDAARLARAQGAPLFGGCDLDLLRLLLQTHGPLGVRSELARGLSDAAFGALASDLRGQLAALLVDPGEGALRDLAGRALAGLDLEELLNVLRREAGEAAHLSIPLPDGDAWTTAHLLLLQREADDGAWGEADDAGEAEGSYRVVLGVEFSALGKVRADLLLRGDAVAARLRASLPRTAALLRASRGDLEALLGGEGRRVTLSILDGSDEEVSVERLIHDVRYLREHHLMDVEG
jgi:hypothetical protein